MSAEGAGSYFMEGRRGIRGGERRDLEEMVQRIIDAIGEDSKREGLVETPARVVASWEELYAGYLVDPMEYMKVFEGANVDEMVLVSNIPVRSQCEHHMLPFIGVAHIAYIPNGKILGVSKFTRIVDAFSRRLQVQERLTMQIADCVEEGLDPLGVAVFIEAQHLCMALRGINERGELMQTSVTRGAFREQPALRAEFMSRLPRS